MFVVCDLLNRLFKPLPSDLEAVENMVNKKANKAVDEPKEEGFCDRLSIGERNKLINKLMQSKFLMDSKYKAHKECWVAVLSQLTRANINQINNASKQSNNDKDSSPGVWDQIGSQIADESEHNKLKDQQKIDSAIDEEAFTQICRDVKEKIKKS